LAPPAGRAPPKTRIPENEKNAPEGLAPGFFLAGAREKRPPPPSLPRPFRRAIAEYGLGALTALSPLPRRLAGAREHGCPHRLRTLRDGDRRGTCRRSVVLGGLAARLPKGPAIIAAFTAFGIILFALAAAGSLPVALALAAAFGLANANLRRAQSDAVPAAHARRDARTSGGYPARHRERRSGGGHGPRPVPWPRPSACAPCLRSAAC